MPRWRVIRHIDIDARGTVKSLVPGLRVWAIFAATLVLFCMTTASYGHGFVGNRFFPPTISTDDPSTADELALPTISAIKTPGIPETREIDAGFEFDKLIFPHLALGVSETYISLKPTHERSSEGWGNLELSLKYELWTSPAHEAIVSLGVRAEIGGTGARRVDADSFTTFEPTLFFGKGFGDLPDSLWALKPFCVTGSIGQTFPTNSSASNVLDWGFALQYSIPYLQQHVKDMGIPAPFKNLIPIVEFPFETVENRDGRGITTGSINPGILYESRYFQIGAEAIIPINHTSGNHVGGIIQVWIFIDDLFPQYFGHPLFGE